ncbi:MAG TPA: MarR family transcriptional regulator [Beijerinckiaceae bacterium]|jgi:DNA-binding MarR family transcriptional regulator|nr:MarR family transcriptional regulator [Beijerinckiaceae bacterium]
MSAKAYKPPLTISRSDYLRNGSDRLFRESIYAMVQCTSRLLACRDAFGNDLSLTASQFAVLMGVAYRQNSEGVTIKELAEHVALASTHVTTEVGRLERKGLLLKRQNAADRRSVHVSLSTKGEEAIAHVSPLVRMVNDTLFEGIDPEALETARQVARQLILNSDEALAKVRRRRREARSSTA